MIKDVSDVRRLPRLGKIHLGIKMKNEKGVEYPRAVDYFVVPEEIQKVYGEEPKKLKIILPSENPDVFFPQWYKKYSMGKGLICKGDGVTANRISLDDNNAMMEITCNKETCEDFLKGDCKPVANLLFILPDVPGFGVYQTDTSSYNNIINLNSEIALLKNLLGRISGIPLELTRETQEVIAKGKRQTIALIHIRSPYSMNDLLKNAKQLSASPQEAAIEVPDNDIPESVPEEIKEGPPEEGEVQPEPLVEEKPIKESIKEPVKQEIKTKNPNELVTDKQIIAIKAILRSLNWTEAEYLKIIGYERFQDLAIGEAANLIDDLQKAQKEEKRGKK